MALVEVDVFLIAGAAAAAVALFALYQRLRSKPKDLLRLPYLKFEDGNDSRERYVTDTPALLQIGYDRYLKHGQAFAMLNYVDENHPQVVLPIKYLKEVRNAPESKLSFPYYSEQIFSLRDTGGIFHTHEATQMIRVDLNRHLNALTPRMHDEANAALEKVLPSNNDWAPVSPYAFFSYAISRVTALALAGPELAHNDEWIGLTAKITVDIMTAAQGVRAKWRPYTRWAARWFFEPVKVVLASKRRAAELLKPVLEKRKAALREGTAGREKGSTPNFNDGVQWLLETYEAKNRKLTPEDLAHHELFAAIGAITSSVATTVGVLFDLLDHPEYLGEILQEVEEVRKEAPALPRQALNKLWKLDSFLKESQRLHSVGQVRLNRAAVVPFTFKDGLHLPAGTQISFLLQVPGLDPDLFPDPQQFKPWRFLRKREQGDADKNHFASVSDDNIFFGNGAHSCPGRFFVTDEIKLILVHLLTKYEFKYANDGEKRPADIIHDNASYPNIMTQVLYRKK
ncbi:hypothetical protein AJ80_05110 [Polytolypa hystricis UAMH7299]|uniref:Uncharacterized protein n=1 Tax=Polytolypa hystricis (strain UAMH7299) TaxID=1447883 RepID=A0A2B7Y6G2_POLH7|nr:hypothetical protein AJ80_05110 [Polytolypa hystricis UAMH7299]